MSIRFTPQQIREKYDEIAPRYDRMERVGEMIGFARIRRRHFGRASGEVLEVAAGTGLNLPYYPADCRVTAIDLSPEMLRRAQGRAAELGREVETRVMDAESLDFPDDQFDTVTSSLSSCTFPNPVEALREMGRVCRPDGRILLLEHGRSRWRLIGWLQDRFENIHARRCACHWNREPHELVEAAGLDLMRDRRLLLGIFHEIEARPARQP